MIDLRVIIQNCNLNENGNYFCVIQIDEYRVGEKGRNTQKYRTEVLYNSSNLIFKKNVFNFEGMSFNSRLVLKVGCFNTRLLNEPVDAKVLMEHSVLKGVSSLTFNSKIMETLKLESQINQDLTLQSEDSQQNEMGRVTATIRLKSHDLVAHIQQDVDKIERIYYDPYEVDKDVIRERINRIGTLLQSKQDELNQIQKKAVFMRNAHKSVSYDQATLQNQRDYLERENLEFRQIIDRKNDVKELHIQVDLLKTSKEGHLILAKKLGLLITKLQFERQLYNELSNHYYSIEGEFKISKGIEKDLQQVKDSMNEQEFIIQRYQDQIPQVNNLKETIQNQEDIVGILNEKHQYKSESLGSNQVDNEVELQNRNARFVVQPRKIKSRWVDAQIEVISGLIEMGKGELQKEVFERYRNDSYIADNPILIGKFKQRAEILLKEVELISEEQLLLINKRISQNYQNQQELKDQKSQNEIKNDSGLNILLLQIQQADNKAEILQDQIIILTRSYGQEMGDLQAQMGELDAELLFRKSFQNNGVLKTKQYDANDQLELSQQSYAQSFKSKNSKQEYDQQSNAQSYKNNNTEQAFDMRSQQQQKESRSKQSKEEQNNKQD